MNPKHELIALYVTGLRLLLYKVSKILRQQEQLSYEDFALAIMKQELDARLNQQKRRIKQAGFPHEKTLKNSTSKGSGMWKQPMCIN